MSIMRMVYSQNWTLCHNGSYHKWVRKEKQVLFEEKEEFSNKEKTIVTRLYILNPPNWTCQFLNYLRKDVKHNNVRVYTSTDLPLIQPNYCLLPKFCFFFFFIQRQTILTAIFLLKKVAF